MPELYITPNVLSRFWAKVHKNERCWEWTAGKKANGYGHFNIQHGMPVRAHRFAWEIVAGSIPKGLRVLHTCDNRPCVRNDDEGWYEVNGVLRPRRGHLFLGTDADNTADMMAKGRHSPAPLSCPTGHIYDEANTYINPKGRRICRKCARRHGAEFRTRARAQM